MSDVIVLKKYANRRLYDTEKSVYVTLDQVAERIREGNRIRAVDAKTGEDVTDFILTQIVLEKARRKNALLPAPLLHMIIRYGDNLLGEFFDKYLEQTLKNYLVYKSKVDEQFRRWLDIGMDITDISRKTIPGISPFQFFRHVSKKENETEANENREESDDRKKHR